MNKKKPDLSELFQPAWKKTDRQKAMAVMERCTSQRKLERIAREAWMEPVWKGAVDRITDLEALCRLAMSDANTSMSLRALERLTDQTLLAKTALSATADRDVRACAAERLTDQAALEQMVRSDKDERVRLAAVAHLTDEKLRTELAVNDPSSDVRQWAAEHVTDQEALLGLARSDKYWRVRQKAIRRIADERLRAELALADRDADTSDRIRALDVLSPDDAGLEELIRDSGDYTFNKAVIARIRDPEALMRTARQVKLPGSEEALERIGDRERLLTLLGEEKTALRALRRMRALGMLDDEAAARVHPSVPKETVELERDRLAFEKKLASPEYAAVAAAYRASDVDRLCRLAYPEAVEAMIMLMRREAGSESVIRGASGGPSPLMVKIEGALIRLWYHGPKSLHPALRKANDWKFMGHGDNDAVKSSCHWDEGPIVFNFPDDGQGTDAGS